MNRGLLIVFAPALLVALAYLGIGWNLRVSLSLGLALLAVAGGAMLWRRGKRA